MVPFLKHLNHTSVWAWIPPKQTLRWEFRCNNLRVDPRGTVKGWSSKRGGKETSRGWTNYCVTMVGNWDSGLWEAMWNMPVCGSWNFYPSTPISHWWRYTPGPKNILRQKDARSHKMNGNWLPFTYRMACGHVGGTSSFCWSQHGTWTSVRKYGVSIITLNLKMRKIRGLKIF